MKKIIIGLFMLFSVVCFASQASWADCPNAPISCGYGAIGWQGTCWHGIGGCQTCGPKHCPSLITSYKKLHHQINTPCISKMFKSKRIDGCSTPAGVNILYSEVFKAACNEHDICYHTNVSKTTCDNYFHSNMNQICDSYYTGFLNRAQEAACKAAADAFFMAVNVGKFAQDGWNSDQGWKKKNCSPKKKKKEKRKNKKK